MPITWKCGECGTPVRGGQHSCEACGPGTVAPYDETSARWVDEEEAARILEREGKEAEEARLRAEEERKEKERKRKAREEVGEALERRHAAEVREVERLIQELQVRNKNLRATNLSLPIPEPLPLLPPFLGDEGEAFEPPKSLSKQMTLLGLAILLALALASGHIRF